MDGLRLVTVPSDRPDDVLQALQRLVEEKESILFPYDPARGTPSLGARPHRAGVIVETSGSSGAPKRVWLDVEAIEWSATASSDAAGSRGVWWLALPCHYVAGLQVLTRSIVSGTTPVIAPVGGSTVERLRASAAALRVAHESGSPLYTSLVPTQLSDILDEAEADDSLAQVFALFSRVLVGGQRVPEGLIERAQQFGVHVTKTYGAAETAGGCVWDGVPLEGVSVDIIDGKVALSGPMLAGGYVDNPALEAEVFITRDSRRWFLSSDTGSFDQVLRVSGRVDDVIISGGVKVNLGEIEAIVHRLGAAEAIVTSRSDKRWGEVPVVVSVTPLDLAELRDAVGGSLGEAARPVGVVTVESIPTLSSGKPDRLAVKRVAAEHSSVEVGQ